MWDPQRHRDFGDHRERSFHDLLARVGALDPWRVVDVGCGPGTLIPVLAQRWPGAQVEAFDSSPEMVAAARERGVDARVDDARTWFPVPDTDVPLTNVVLQWVPEHPDVMRRWAQQLAAGARLAVQVPGNFVAPSHVLVRELATEPRWAGAMGGVLRRAEMVLEPAGYAELLTDAGCAVDVGETTYSQWLEGADPVLAWMAGAALGPVRAALDDEGRAGFRAELAPGCRRLTRALPTAAPGSRSGGCSPWRRSERASPGGCPCGRRRCSRR